MNGRDEAFRLSHLKWRMRGFQFVEIRGDVFMYTGPIFVFIYLYLWFVKNVVIGFVIGV